MKKLKHAEIKPTREAMLIKQGNKCLLCGHDLSLEDAVLDHQHQTGLIRGVIHRNDNLLLGKIENALVRNRITDEQLLGVMQNLISYINSATDLLHPTHRTPEEKKQRAKVKAKKKRTLATK